MEFDEIAVMVKDMRKGGIWDFLMFERFFRYGGGENEAVYKMIAEEFGLSEEDVREVARRGEWVKRVEERIESLRNLSGGEFGKREYREVIRLAIWQFLEQLMKGEIGFNSVNDLVNLMKLDLQMVGTLPSDEAKISIITAVPRVEGDRVED